MFGIFGPKGRTASKSGAVAKKVLLLVEDDPGLREAIARHLIDKEGYTVLAADSYPAAAKHLEAGVPDIACIDLELPSESGYELCEYMRSRPLLEYVPVLVTGERSSPEDMLHAEEAGANAFLVKPFTIERLATITNELLAGSLLSRPGTRLLRLM